MILCITLVKPAIDPLLFRPSVRTLWGIEKVDKIFYKCKYRFRQIFQSSKKLYLKRPAYFKCKTWIRVNEWLSNTANIFLDAISISNKCKICCFWTKPLALCYYFFYANDSMFIVSIDFINFIVSSCWE